MSAHDRSILDRRTLLKRSAVALPAIAGAGALKPALGLGAPSAASHLAPSAPEEELIAGNSAFAFDIYSELRQIVDGNLVFSPYSLSTALAMTYAGAGGETATQMADTLSFTLQQPALHEAFRALSADLEARGNAEATESNSQRSSALHIANAVWGEQTYPFSKTYSDLLDTYYGAKPEQVDFINEPEAAQQEINDWVAEQTEDLIQDIVPDGAITSDTRLVLTDAIYFSGGWQNWFHPDYTSDDAFHLVDGTSVTVPFMYRWTRFPYARANGFQVIEFPYQGSGFTFTVILPDDGAFNQFEQGLDAAEFSAAVGQATTTEIKVYLPKFAFDASANFNEILKSLGMVNAFDATLADFTAMVEGTPPDPLAIGEVLHKAFISIDEEGTEAAAATVVVSVTGGEAVPAEEPIEVHIDRPFIFAIRDVETGTLLFLGRVMNPTE